MVTILFADTVDMSCWRISILQQSGAILSISAAFVKTTMTFHSPRAMVATGPHGENQPEPSLGKNSHPPQLGLLTLMRRSPRQGECRGFSVWRLVSGGTSPTLLWVSNYTSLSNHQDRAWRRVVLTRLPLRAANGEHSAEVPDRSNRVQR